MSHKKLILIADDEVAIHERMAAARADVSVLTKNFRIVWLPVVGSTSICTSVIP